MSQVVKKNSSVEFTSTGCKIFDSAKRLTATGTFENYLFKLNVFEKCIKSFHVSDNSSKIYGLSHINDASLMKMKTGMVN